MKKLRFVIFVMLIMLLLCSAARAVRPAPEALPGQIQKPPAQQEVFHMYRLSMLRAQNRSSTTFSGGTSSSAGLCIYIFMYLNEEA